jgi:hypothetical protein
MDIEPNPEGEEQENDFDKEFNPEDCPTIDGVEFKFRVPDAEIPMITEGSLKPLPEVTKDKPVQLMLARPQLVALLKEAYENAVENLVKDGYWEEDLDESGVNVSAEIARARDAAHQMRRLGQWCAEHPDHWIFMALFPVSIFEKVDEDGEPIEE